MKHAFSLVELSIVLVILGLLTGGILAGQNLIRAAELRSVTTQFTQYQTAIMTFQDKYFAYPGDMNNATEFWGEAGGSGQIGDGCEAVYSTGKETCNGNGDGNIGTSADSDINNHESGRFWQHLANAGLIEGTYTGVVTGSTLKGYTAGVNSPKGKFPNSSFTIRTMGDSVPASNTGWYEGTYDNTYHFGGPGNVMHTAPILEPSEAWNLDTKLDDGKPGLSRIVSKENDVDCATDTDANLSEYALTNSGQLCSLSFRGF